jgi:regulator of replication initiation timing
MKKMYRMLVLGVLAGLLFGGMLLAEDRDRDGSVGGTFIRLVEREVGEREYMGIVIKPFDRDDHVTVLVPRQREELWRAARRLQEGQKVGVTFVTEAGHKFIKGMETERREVVEEGLEGRRRVNVRREVLRWDDDVREGREAERPAHLEQMEGQLKEVVSGHLERMGRALKEVLGEHLERMEAELRELRAHIERMQEELQELRAENERLRWQLRERGGPEREREREVRREIEERREVREREEREERREAERRREGAGREEREVRKEGEMGREVSLPEGMIGFRGIIIGRIVRKLDRGFVLKVERVTKVWQNNKADKPEASVGKDLIITIPADEEIGRPFLRTLRALKIGEPVLVEAFHFEGNRLILVEQLRKYD